MTQPDERPERPEKPEVELIDVHGDGWPVLVPVQMPKPPKLTFDEAPVPPSPRTVQNLRRRRRVIE